MLRPPGSGGIRFHEKFDGILAASMLNGSRIVVFGVIQLPSLLAVNEPL